MNIKTTFDPIQDQYLQLQAVKAYYTGIKDGLGMYAWWRDGTQYVGTCGKTLAEALADVDRMEQGAVTRLTKLAGEWWPEG